MPISGYPTLWTRNAADRLFDRKLREDERRIAIAGRIVLNTLDTGVPCRDGLPIAQWNGGRIIVQNLVELCIDGLAFCLILSGQPFLGELVGFLIVVAREVDGLVVRDDPAYYEGRMFRCG